MAIHFVAASLGCLWQCPTSLPHDLSHNARFLALSSHDARLALSHYVRLALSYQDPLVPVFAPLVRLPENMLFVDQRSNHGGCLPFLGLLSVQPLDPFQDYSSVECGVTLFLSVLLFDCCCVRVFGLQVDDIECSMSLRSAVTCGGGGDGGDGGRGVVSSSFDNILNRSQDP